jgi:hypothetical protein
LIGRRKREEGRDDRDDKRWTGRRRRKGERAFFGGLMLLNLVWYIHMHNNTHSPLNINTKS